MSRRTVFATELFELPRQLAANWTTFRRELAALRPDEFVPWVETAAYSRGWEVYSFVMTTMPPGFDVDFRAHRARCPDSWRLLRDPRIVLAAFSRLQPGCHIYPHRDHCAFDVLRFHLGLSNTGHAGMRIDGTTLEQRPGQHYVFDTSHQHEAGNLGTQPRDVLLVDFRLSDDEVALVDRLRASPDDGPRADAAAGPV